MSEHDSSDSNGCGGTLCLHLDDINEQQAQSTRAVEEDSAKSELALPKAKLPKTKEHIKLFRQYISSCKEQGIDCALDPESPTESSETSDDGKPVFDVEKRRLSLVRPRQFDSFLNRRRSSSFTGTGTMVDGHFSESGASAACSESSSVGVPSSPIRRLQAQVSPPSPSRRFVPTNEGSVYKSQVATALEAGKTVWL
mmetsp:Transcript_22197/g.60679  ORF Transcript_22197/g.60679 Transcript_22197/m.60679 type:complete len:197 (-) Transcript_22197:124-714(-)